ncbi:MAG: GC-type dockerin domain-anchored protein [Planctomycetota bacterium]
MAIPRLGSALAAITAFNTAAQIHVFVDDDAPDGGNGLSWERALNDLRDAVQLAEDLGEFRGEIRIAGGDYLGDLAEPLEIDRFGGQLSGLVLKGGFAGLAMPGAEDTRALSAFVTTLRGVGNAPIVQISSAAILTGPRELGPGPFGALSGINLARATVFDGLRFEGQQGIFVSTFFLTDINAAVVVRDCEFVDGGTGWGTAEGGGAIGAGGASFLIERSRFFNNRSNRGGAISHQFSALVIEDCLFAGNGASSGGAVWSSASALRVEDSTFVGNMASGSQGEGGALRVGLSELVLLRDVALLDNTAFAGGAVSAWRSTLHVADSTFERNIAESSGGAVFAVGGDHVLDFDRSSFKHNGAGGDGGAVCFDGSAGPGTVVAGECTAIGNIAGNRGGAFFGGTVGVGFTDLDRNEADTGGAIFGDTVNAFASLFDSNRAEGDGGAIYTRDGGFVSSGRFERNAGVRGGAVFGPLEVRTSWFEHNAASRDGGALHGTPLIDESDFVKNTAGLLGGAVFGAGRVTESFFSGNSAGQRGGAVYSLVFGDQLEVIDNSAGFGGGGIRLEGEFELSRSIITGNTLTQLGPNAGDQVVIDGGVGLINRCLIAPAEVRDWGALAARLGTDLTMFESLVGGQTRVERSWLDARGCTFVGKPQSSLPVIRATAESVVVAESVAIYGEFPVQLSGFSFGVFTQSYIRGGETGVDGDALRVDFLGEIVSGDPGFVDPLGPDGDWSTWEDNDYRPRPRSRLIDAGFGLGTEFDDIRSRDLEGNSRSRSDTGVPSRFVGPHPIDIGAYEFQGSSCLPDMNGDGRLSPGDFNAWILAYNMGDRFADQNNDGVLTPGDFNAWTMNFNAGCD